MQSKNFKDALEKANCTENVTTELLVHNVNVTALRVLVKYMQLAADIIRPELEHAILDSIAPCQYFDSYALQELLNLSRLLDIPALSYALNNIAEQSKSIRLIE